MGTLPLQVRGPKKDLKEGLVALRGRLTAKEKALAAATKAFEEAEEAVAFEEKLAECTSKARWPHTRAGERCEAFSQSSEE